MVTSKIYFQKSKIFLLPLTGMKKRGKYEVTNTYLYWDKCDGIDNYQLIVYYKNNDELEFKEFEKNTILQNPNVISCYKVEEGNVYIFDLGKWADDIYSFMNGKYSKLSNKAKDKIMLFENFNTISDKPIKDINGNILFTVHIALYPEIYYEEAKKELLYTKDNFLKDNNLELWSIFNKEKETMIKNIEDQYFENNTIKE